MYSRRRVCYVWYILFISVAAFCWSSLFPFNFVDKSYSKGLHHNTISYDRENSYPDFDSAAESDSRIEKDTKWINRRNDIDLTPLGKWLLADEDAAPPIKNNNSKNSFVILVWENGPFLERRHLKRFSTDKKFSPWENCSVNNCRLTYDSKDLHTSDAVIFHLHRTKNPSTLPKRKNFNQRWIFLTDESPFHTFLYRNQKLSDYNGLFNWSMTYRMDSDIPVPYGRTVRLSKSNATNKNLKKRKYSSDKLVAVLGSNCSGKNNRWGYIKKLKYILGDRLKILGRCLNGNTTACPGHFDSDCPELRGFKFYLAFENSNCREYFSEKIYWNSYAKGSVPVIMGAPINDCEKLLPPKSYLHVDDFANSKSLANYLTYLDRFNHDYESLHAWRSKYRVINEHGYFGSPSKHYCRVCEALNYNSVENKVYDDLLKFWSEKRDCEKPV